MPTSDGVWGLQLNKDGYTQQRISCGAYWRQTVLTNNFFWEAWVQRHADAPLGYLIADGYGGGHALLWGLNTGNVWLGGSAAQLQYMESLAYDIPQHCSVAMGKDFTGQDVISVWLNGICCGVTPFTGTRTNILTASSGQLFIGGSDHINGSFTIHMMRAYDNQFPYGVNKASKNFVPERWFGNRSYSGMSYASLPTFLIDCTLQQRLIADHSVGYVAETGYGAIRHHGNLDSGWYKAEMDRPQNLDSNVPFPIWTYRAEHHPWTTRSSPVHPDDSTVFTLGTPLANSIVYDSFQRAEQTFAWRNAPTLGSTEAGSAGTLTWVQSPWGGDAFSYGYGWGIFNGQAVCLEDEPRSHATVNCGTSTHKVRCSRSILANTYKSIALVFRGVDSNNFLVGSFEGADFTQGRFEIGKVVAGTYTQLWRGALEASGTWNELIINANGSTISIYADGALKQTITDSTHLTGTRVGICHPGSRTTPGHVGYGTSRWNNFCVQAAD